MSELHQYAVIAWMVKRAVSYASIQKRFALSLTPLLFSKAVEMISGVFKSVSSVINVEILSVCLQYRKNTFRKLYKFE